MRPNKVALQADLKMFQGGLEVLVYVFSVPYLKLRGAIVVPFDLDTFYCIWPLVYLIVLSLGKVDKNKTVFTTEFHCFQLVGVSDFVFLP